jgi:hypothetical protein
MPKTVQRAPAPPDGGGTGHPARKCYGDPWDPDDTFVDYGEVDLSHGMNVLEELPTAEIERSNADAILTRSAQRF